MFGIPGSINIIDKINNFVVKDKKNNKKYKAIIAPPHILLQEFSKKFKKKKVSICAQNCFHKDHFGAHTGSISPFMIKKAGVNQIIIGHSEIRASGDNDKIIKDKVFHSLKNKLNIVLCIGENKTEKKKRLTLRILKKQLTSVLKRKYNFDKIIIAYEPIWSIGTGKVPNKNELEKIIISIKKFLKTRFRSKHKFKILYGGSVDKKSIYNFKLIKELDGFLIGGASKSSKNFIDIIRNFYK